MAGHRHRGRGDHLPGVTFLVFAIWVAVVLAFYFLYGIRHSRLEQGGADPGRRGQDQQ